MGGSATQTARGSIATTDGIVVRVEPAFMPDHSDPAADRYVFSYRILVANDSDSTVTLLSRHWLVVDANGREREVDGEGVIGQQPVIEPGQTFEYSSWCPLSTAWGTMEGHYTFRTSGGNSCRAAIARFYLVSETD